MTNEAMRRLLCCSENLNQSTRDEIMEDFARMWKRSGYSERFRHEVISDALRGYKKKLQVEAEGGRPVDRLREYQEVERRMRRSEKKGERYYRKEKRGSKVREGVIIIPPTPNSILAKEMKKICEEELRGSNISLLVQERGGRRLAQELGVTVPGRSQKMNCQRSNCFPCNTNNAVDLISSTRFPADSFIACVAREAVGPLAIHLLTPARHSHTKLLC
jgi:hypothetical protein